MTEHPVTEHRLPRTVVPERYELTLTPDLGTATFSGDERVRLQVLEPVTSIVLNAVELELGAAELTSEDGRTLTGTVTLHGDEQQAVIALDGTADPGTWTLGLSFTGILNDKLAGFYRSTFTDEGGTEHVIATTQFEATDARRAFPCWDEPDFKAAFAVTLVVPEHLTALSNGAAVDEQPAGEGRKRVTFGETIVMSTYLVAFVVGPLEVTDPVDVDGVPLRVAFVPGKRHLADFALESGAAALRYFTGYFGIAYPAGKLDLIALPDFAFGAMENLGCVTFRETALLVDPGTASRTELERVVDVVSHEIAHMWFGDLVTMKWWNGIWLNEAFATFMELLAVDDFRPEWQRWVSFGISRAAAMATDGLASTRPIEYPVVRPDEAQGMFDILTYQKGGAVLRMLEQYLGAEPFRKGIRQYLETHQFGNAETTDLFDALQEASGEPVRSTMDTWIFQGGHPMVSVAAEPTGLTLTQERFRYLEDGSGSDSGSYGPRWHVPVLLRAGVGDGVEQRRLLLTEASTSVDLGGQPSWVVVNENGSGFYRVRYPSALLQRLTADLGSLSALERFGLVSDTWATTLAGRTPLADFCNLARLLGGETDPNVWAAVLGPLSLLDRIAHPTDVDNLEAFVRALVSPAFERLGWQPQEGEPETTGTMRSLLLGALGTIGADEDVRREARELHTAYLDDRSALPPDLVGAVVTIVARTGGPAEYETYRQRFRSAATPQEEVRYLFALAAFEDTELVQRTCALSVSDEVRTQNAPYLLGGLYGNKIGGPLAWDFTVEHWDELLERFPDNSIVRMLDGVTHLSTPGLAADVRAFLETHPVPQGQKTLEQILERLEVNTRFRERETAHVGAALGAG